MRESAGALRAFGCSRLVAALSKAADQFRTRQIHTPDTSRACVLPPRYRGRGLAALIPPGAASLSFLVLLVATGCIKPRPPVVQPTPPPVVDEVPAKGVPVKPEMLLRTEGTRLRGVDLFMAVACCEAFPGGNSRWPWGGEKWQDYTAGFGANAFHGRLPFIGDEQHESEWADVGGTYLPGSLEFNPKFWETSREIIYHAAKNGHWYEVAWDAWLAKHCEWGDQDCPLPREEMIRWYREPSAEAERLLREAVRQYGCLGNVIWLLDNEGDQIRGYKPEWWAWARYIIRDEEAKSGCGFVHMIGATEAVCGQVEVDYCVTHRRAPLLGPMHSKFSINNERNPAFSPEQEASNFATAREAGQAYAYWRAGQTDEQMAQTLSLFRDIAKGGQAECFAPDSEDEAWKPGPVVSRCETEPALRQAQAEVGDRRALWPANGTPEQRFNAMFQSLDLLAASMRRQGLCASRSRDGIMARTQDMPAGRWCELHPVAATDGGFTGTPFKGSTWVYQQ